MRYKLDCGHIFQVDDDKSYMTRVVKCSCGKETDLTDWAAKAAASVEAKHE